MKKLFFLILLLNPFVFKAFSGTTATVDMNLTISTVNEIAFTETAGGITLDITTATAGSEPDPATDTGDYGISTNDTTAAILCKYSTAGPSAGTLSITLTAPTASGTSAGAVEITVADANLVTAISNTAESTIGSSYSYAATLSEGSMTQETCEITYTLGTAV